MAEILPTAGASFGCIVHRAYACDADDIGSPRLRHGRNQPTSRLLGAIDADAADKMAPVVELCDAHGIPLVSLIDSPGFYIGQEAERGGIARHHVRTLSAIEHRDVPLYCVQIRKAYGLGPLVMRGSWGHLPPDLRIAWPSVETGGMSLEGAAYLAKRKEIQAAKTPEEARAIRDDYAETLRKRESGIRAGQNFSFDDIVHPAETRDRIIAMLELTPGMRRAGKKLYLFARYFARKLPPAENELPKEITEAIDLESFRLQQTSSGAIALDRGENELEPMHAEGSHHAKESEQDALSSIIRDLNEKFGRELTEEDAVRFTSTLLGRLHEDERLQEHMRNNPPENARLTFDLKAKDQMQDLVETDFDFYRRVTDDEAFRDFFFARLFELFRKEAVDAA